MEIAGSSADAGRGLSSGAENLPETDRDLRESAYVRRRIKVVLAVSRLEAQSFISWIDSTLRVRLQRLEAWPYVLLNKA